MPEPTTFTLRTFRSFTVCAVVALGAGAAREALAQNEFFPIEGAGGATVNCVNDATVQRTGRPYGSSPTTITGCTLAGDTPFALGQPSYTVYCKGGHLVQFYPGSKNLKSCSLAYDTTSLQNSAGAQVPCKGGGTAEFGADGRLIVCNGQRSATGNGGLFRPVSPQAAGNTPAAQPPSLFSFASPATSPDIAGYAERSREFVESALDGDYGRALKLAGERFRRDIGEKGLAYFRDYVSREGPAQFIAQAVYDEDGYVVVAGALALPNRRTMMVHVLFRGGQVEHLFERWGRR